MATMQEWKDQALEELELECKRLLARISIAKTDTKCSGSFNWSAVRRSSLDVSKSVSRLRAGFWKSIRN